MDTASIKRPNQNDRVRDQILAEHYKLSSKRSMSVRREEYLDYMTFRSNARTLYREHLGPFVGLKEEWRSQGARDEELDLSAFPYVEPLFFDCGVFTGYYGPDLSEVLSDTTEEILYRDYMGVLHRLIKKSSSLGHPLDFPVKDRSDWERIRPFYEYHPGRVPREAQEAVARAKAQGQVICASVPGGFDEIRVLLGDEMALMGPYTDPDLISDILSVIGDTAVRVLAELGALFSIDQLNIHEDMAGKSGPLWGPIQVDAFMVPYYSRCVEAARAAGAHLFNVDSDGDCRAILPSFVRAGINMFHPCEPASNMDMVQLRAQFGTALAFEGGIDKYALLGSFQDIDRELQYRVPPMVTTGGCILGLDHRIPNGVPLANYRYYIQRLREIIEAARRT